MSVKGPGMSLLARDQGAARFAALFEAELGYVWTSLRRLGVASRDLEDVAHEVFLAVHARLDVFDETRPARPWLFAFCARKAADYRKRAIHRVELYGEDEPATPSDVEGSPEEHALRRERTALVERALARLDDDARAVLILHDLDEVPMPAVADALGIPLNTGYSRLRTARAAFAASVRRLSRGDAS